MSLDGAVLGDAAMTNDVLDPPILDNDDPRLNLIEGLSVTGELNTPMPQILEQIRYGIRQGHPQARKELAKPDRIALVGGGPSLAGTLPELRELVFAGAKVITVNGAYHWCLEHNIFPTAQIVLDAKPSTARFLLPAIPRCTYFIASQCHPDTWAAVAGRDRVVIYHALNTNAKDIPEVPILNAYYGEGKWLPIVGGSTVTTRALVLLRHGGFLRFDLFGIDCCWLHGQHHAFAQPENDRDKRYRITVQQTRGEPNPQHFECAPWHVTQFNDLLQMIRVNGQHFLLNVHGSGLLAYAMRAGTQIVSHVHTEESVL